MTRTPLEEVNFMGKNGRWGRMIVVRGGKVLSGRFTDVFDLPDLFAAGILPGAFGTIANLTSAVLSGGFGQSSFRIGHKGICLETFGGDVEVVARFDTLERFRTDSNRSKYYVQLKPRPEKRYEMRMDISQNVKGKIGKDGEKKKGVNETGRCLRVHGHNTNHSGGSNAGILLHEASHPGWLVGCIAPREVDKRIANNDFGPSRSAMNTLFELMGGFAPGRSADLLVMDW